MNALFKLVSDCYNNSDDSKNDKTIYSEDVSKFIDSYLVSDNEMDIYTLQASIIAIYDTHNRLYNSSHPKILLDNYVNKNIIKLYTELIDCDIKRDDKVGFKLNRICTHKVGNTVKQVVSSYTTIKTALTNTASTLIDNMIDKTKHNKHNLANDKNVIRNITNVLNELIKYLSCDAVTKGILYGVNKNDGFNEHDEIMVLMRQLEDYFNLPIITKNDLKYFIEKLQKIDSKLQCDYKKCLECQNILLNLSSGMVKDSKSSLRIDINRIRVVNEYIGNLITIMQVTVDGQHLTDKKFNADSVMEEENKIQKNLSANNINNMFISKLDGGKENNLFISKLDCGKENNIGGDTMYNSYIDISDNYNKV